MIILLIAALIKKTLYKMGQYFPNHMNHLVVTLMLRLIYLIMRQRMISKILHMLILALKKFALKTNLPSLKTEVDKLDIDKLVPIPNDLSKLSNIVKSDVVKKNCI